MRSTTQASLVVLVLGLGACGAPPPTSQLTPTPPIAEAAADAFHLGLRAGAATYRAGEPISIDAVLVYDGPAAQIEVAGSGSGLVGFGVEQLDGRVKIEPGGTADCAPWTLRRGRNSVQFQKSGGYSNDDPLADFYRAYFADPALRLPAGEWRISAHALFLRPECKGEPITLEASIELSVVD